MNTRALQNNMLPLEPSKMRRLILIISLIGLVATSILTVTAIVDNNLIDTVLNGSTAILLSISLVTAWFGSMSFGRLALPFTALVSISYLSIVGKGIYEPGNLAFVIVIAISAFLLGSRGLLIYGALSIGSLSTIIYGGMLGIFQHEPASAPDILVALGGFIVSTIILFLNTRQLERNLHETRLSEQAQIQINQELLETIVSLEKQTEELARANEINTFRVGHLRLVADVASTAATIQDLDRLLPTICELISQRFGVYHTGIFLLDTSREHAILRAGSSAGGQKMLMQGYRLQADSHGMIGSVIATGNPHSASKTGMNSGYFDNPHLPDTCSEIALPLKLSVETFGVLDLQSTQADAFSQEETEVFSILANQLAIAIQNARSFESAHKAMQDADAAYRRITEGTWSQFIQSQNILGYHFDGIGAKSIFTPSVEENGDALTIPVRLRGREIGKIKLSSLESGRTWSEDDIAMAEAAAERAALALENARLLQEAHRRAAKEKVIGEASSKISSAINLDNILQTAVREMGRLLPGAEISIQVESDSSPEAS